MTLGKVEERWRSRQGIAADVQQASISGTHLKEILEKEGGVPVSLSWQKIEVFRKKCGQSS